MVEKHSHIFKIKDWYSDFWLSKIYGNSTYCNLNYQVVNLRDKGTRYPLCNRPHWYDAVVRDSSRIQQWAAASRGK